MAREKPATAEPKATDKTPKRVTLKNTRAGNGAIGAIAKPLQKRRCQVAGHRMG